MHRDIAPARFPLQGHLRVIRTDKNLAGMNQFYDVETAVPEVDRNGFKVADHVIQQFLYVYNEAMPKFQHVFTSSKV